MSGLLAVGAETAEFFWHEAGSAGVRHLPMRFAVAAHREDGGGVSFRAAWQDGPETESVVIVEGLGSHLASWEDRDLLEQLLQGFFAAARQELPESAREALFRLCYPPWIGPLERRRLVARARTAGLRLAPGGSERGLALAMVKARQDGAPGAGGWLIVDRCSPDLDVYAVGARQIGADGVLELRSYRRCEGLFSSFYMERHSTVTRIVTGAIERLGPGWPLLAADDEAARLLREALPDVEVENVSFADLLAVSNTEADPPSWRLQGRGRLWLDHGDERLVSLSDDDSSLPMVKELLFAIPEPAPVEMRVALRAGFAPTRAETHELCSVVLSRPAEFFAAPGHLLVKADQHDHGRVELTVEVLQNGRRVDEPKRARFEHELADLA